MYNVECKIYSHLKLGSASYLGGNVNLSGRKCWRIQTNLKFPSKTHSQLFCFTRLWINLMSFPQAFEPLLLEVCHKNGKTSAKVLSNMVKFLQLQQPPQVFQRWDQICMCLSGFRSGGKCLAQLWSAWWVQREKYQLRMLTVSSCGVVERQQCKMETREQILRYTCTHFSGFARGNLQGS